ncbi:MAG: ABC transporter permease [Salinivirgaceae bacterium]|nr:ABC transporter permease [Salinivirgaceae bacterium]
MFDRELYKEIWQAISKNRTRSILTAFGVFWGLFMLITLAGAGNGLRNGVLAQYSNVAKNTTLLWTNNTTIPYGGFRRNHWWNFKNSDVVALNKQYPELYIVPRITRWSGGGASYNLRTSECSVVGEYPITTKVEYIKLECGRYINEMDILQRRKVCVIGPRVREELFPNGEDPLGKNISLSGVYYKVVGAYSGKGVGIGFNYETAVRLPFSTMQQTYNLGDNVGMLIIGAPADHDIGDVEAEVMRFIRSRHKDVSPDDNEALSHENLNKTFKQITNLFLGVDLLIWLVGLGTLLAGVIGISNIMLVIVKERTQEIGIKRALGATPGNIIRQIITESVLLTVVAGYLGLVLGVLINEGLGVILASSGNSIFMNPGINLSVGLVCLTILVVCGALAGLLPAMRAVKIKPIDAIREE